MQASVAVGTTFPAMVAGTALAVSGASTYWDIASHVDGGRERFLTPSHIGIYSGVTIALALIALAILSDRIRSGASRLGDVLAGRTRRPRQAGVLTKLVIVGVLVVAMIPFPAWAHEVGGDAGKGVISWTPAEIEPGQQVRLRIEHLEVTSDADIESPAWRRGAQNTGSECHCINPRVLTRADSPCPRRDPGCSS